VFRSRSRFARLAGQAQCANLRATPQNRSLYQPVVAGNVATMLPRRGESVTAVRTCEQSSSFDSARLLPRSLHLPVLKIGRKSTAKLSSHLCAVVGARTRDPDRLPEDVRKQRDVRGMTSFARR